MIGMTGRVALVTGAGNPHGIGFATARMLAEAGMQVAITATTDRIFERLAELPGGAEPHAAWVADLRASHDATALVAAVMERFGQIDALVNNAGMVQVGSVMRKTRLQDVSDQEWSDTLRTNLDTCFYVSRAVIPHMQARRYGRIVNVSSVTGPVAMFEGGGPYGTAKAGVTGLTRALALELGREGITANAVGPGWINNGRSSARSKASGAATPVGRSGRPEEVAAAILFLASEDSSYVTGQLLLVDGGNMILDHRDFDNTEF
jgi:3-oxoacyl-[acyl-carrier protein] reductase